MQSATKPRSLQSVAVMSAAVFLGLSYSQCVYSQSSKEDPTQTHNARPYAVFSMAAEIKLNHKSTDTGLVTVEPVEFSKLPADKFRQLVESSQLSTMYVCNGDFDLLSIENMREKLKTNNNAGATLNLQYTLELQFENCRFCPRAIPWILASTPLKRMSFDNCTFVDQRDLEEAGASEVSFFSMRCDSLTNIQFVDTYIGEGRVNWSEVFPSIRSMQICRAGIGDRDVTEIAKLVSLTRLDVRGNNLSDRSTTYLTDLKSNREVSIFGLHRNLFSKEWVKEYAPTGELRPTP